MEKAKVTFDALLLNILSSPDASLDSSTYTITKESTSTIRLSSRLNTSITLMSGVTSTTTGPDQTKVTVGDSATLMQSNSTQVANALTLRKTRAQQVTNPAPGSIDNTIYIGLRGPEFQLTGNEKNLQFRLLKAVEQFELTGADLKTNATVKALFRPETIKSFLDAYVLNSNPSGTLLVPPRFKKKVSLLVSPAVRDVRTFASSGSSTFSEEKTVSTSVTITDMVGFESPVLKSTFKVDAKIDVSHTSVQEVGTNKSISLATTLRRSSLGIYELYVDRALGSLVVRDAGSPMMSGQPVVNGRVTDQQGVPIPGALVKLRQDGTEYAAVSDASGNYLIATPAGQQLATGRYQINCGKGSYDVMISNGVTVMNLGGIQAAPAGELLFQLDER
jgi:hypothetical protein